MNGPAFRALETPALAGEAGCAGDCNGDGVVGIDEVLTLVNIDLGTEGVSECLAGDRNGDGTITINELILAVNSALTDCPVPPTALRGSIILPPASQCTNCTNNIIDFGVIGLVQNAPPVLIRSLQTDSQGMYDTGDLNAALSDPANGSVDTNGDGARTVIVVADVNASGAQIGGVDSIQTSVDSMKDFDTTTQVACIAAVYLTAGTTDPCAVRATCDESEPDCVPTVDPDVLDEARIGRLEAAASTIAGDLILPDDVARAACAAIICTDSGTTDASAACVQQVFQPAA